MRLAFTNAIRASETLSLDAELRPKWQDILDNLASPSSPGRGRRPASPGNTAGNQPARPQSGRGGSRPFGAFVYGGPGANPANEPDAELKSRFLGFNALGSFIDTAGIGGAQIFRNRLRLREGPGAIDCEHLGGLTAGIHSSLLDNKPDDEGREEIEVFSIAWPRSWDCAFELLAHGGFVISSSLKDGQIEFIKIHFSPLSGNCRIKNPWPNTKVNVYRDQAKTELDPVDVLCVAADPGDTLTLVPANRTLDDSTRLIP
jgi:hypothetical protein